MAQASFLERVIGWLRAGYPAGVPDVDYVPLFALLGYHLSNDEVGAIAAELEASSDPASADAIKKAITAVTNTKPLESDIDRVRARLAAGGWPLADLSRD
jgi:sirohydrochlorin ferrochelatase